MNGSVQLRAGHATLDQGQLIRGMKHLLQALARLIEFRFYRRYLMGQSPGKSPIVVYTHLNELRQQYQRAVERSLGQIRPAVEKQMEELNWPK